MLRHLCFNILTDSSSTQVATTVRAELVPVLNRINRYASFADLSDLRESMNPSMGFMCALQPGVADTKLSMRMGTSE